MKKFFLFLIIPILCFQLISATVTNIHIKTVPHMNVNVLVQSDNFELYQRFNADADKYGGVSFVFSSDKTEFNLGIYVKDPQDNSKVASKIAENLVAGGDISLEIVPEGFEVIETPAEENISNLSAENSTSENNISNESLLTTSESDEEQSNIQGFAIFSGDSNFKKIIFYVLGAIVLALIIFFIFKKLKKGKGGIKVKKMSDWKEEQKDSTPEQYYGVLEETQKKLEETQRELNAIKNQARIKETEEKLRRDAQELRSLRGF